MTEELFIYFKILSAIPENINSLMWLVVTILDKDISKLNKEEREMSVGD